MRFGSLVEALNLIISPVVFPRCQVKEYYLINNKYRYSTKVLLLPATGSADGRFLHIINMRRTLPTLELPILTELNLEARCTYHMYLVQSQTEASKLKVRLSGLEQLRFVSSPRQSYLRYLDCQCDPCRVTSGKCGMGDDWL